ncbi:MAG: DUF2793 domain-containing protein [Rhizobium sp.]
MSETTVNIALPYILPSQAQKHVTHNEALQRLDATIQLVIAARLSAPPGNVADGECYWPVAPATDEWSGKEGQLAFRQDGAWIFLTPRPGWRAFDMTRGRLNYFNGGEWVDLPLPENGVFSTVGIGADADGSNRLAIASDASLFNHAGFGHQLKINKASASDTASFLFQSNWQGKAEIGLTGSDDLSIKVSPDGSNWNTALAISSAGVVRMDARPVVRASLAATTFTPAAATLTGFDDLHVSQGGFALGAALPSGYGSRLIVPVTGIYQIVLNTSFLASSGHEVAVKIKGTAAVATTRGANASASALSQSATAATWLSAGDWIALEHGGTGQFQFGYGLTEITVVML